MAGLATIVETDLSGYDLLNNPLLNKATAFTEEERGDFELHGLLPPSVASLDEQVGRRLQALRQLPDEFARYVFLRGLQDTNEVLFYALLVRDLAARSAGTRPPAGRTGRRPGPRPASARSSRAARRRRRPRSETRCTAGRRRGAGRPSARRR